ncbi:MAG: cytochrome c3 family protein [Tepidisphaeraceae bacterium]|jgi:predicted CXXCH cytochrome family protein
MLLLCLAGAAAMLAPVCLRVREASGAQRKSTIPSPHWTDEGCKVCHEGDGAAHRVIAPEAVDDLCLKCHDGVKAAAEFHPVHRKFEETASITKPRGWPVVNDLLACATCHDIRYACDPKKNSAALNRNFLRDYSVRRTQGQPFCQNCHVEKAYRKINPHEMLLNPAAPVHAGPQATTAPATQPGNVPADATVLAGGREIIEDKCLFCHTRPLDRNQMKRTGNSFLKTDQATLCRDCHARHKDPMMQSHLGLTVKPEMLALMYVREQMGLAGSPSAAIIEQVAKAGLRPKMMVTAAGNAIVCSTCHNPHQNGVFPAASDLDYRSMRYNRQQRLVSPVHEQVWCRQCHSM